MRTTIQKLSYLQWLASAQGPPEGPHTRSLPISLKSRCGIWLYAIARGQSRPSRTTLNIPSPPFAKVLAIRWHARRYGLRTFVETGTCYGDTTAAVACQFDQCFTIELSRHLYERASARLSTLENVTCLQGDSGKVITGIIDQLSGPALFWLDAHTSGGITANAGYDPMETEVTSILNDGRFPHLILIDDARGHDIDRLRTMANRHTITIRNDIARLVPIP
jgi:hypothetical protein